MNLHPCFMHYCPFWVKFVVGMNIMLQSTVSSVRLATGYAVPLLAYIKFHVHKYQHPSQCSLPHLLLHYHKSLG